MTPSSLFPISFLQLTLPRWTHPVRRAVGILILTTLTGFSQTGHAQEAATPAFKADFEDAATLSPDWKTEGSVSLDTKFPYKGTQSLLLSRTHEDAEKPCSALSPTFKVQPGLWDIAGGVKPDLYSPDSSFDATATLECLDDSGQVVDQITVSDVFGKNGWNPFGGQYEIPKKAVAARFRIELHKTYGQCWFDEISATYVGPAPHKFVDRLVFSTVAEGNLLYPTDSRVVSLSVVAPEELPEASRVVNFVVCDYWGAEQMAPVKVPLTAGPKQGDNFTYTGSIDLASAPLEEGKFYEMIGEIPLPDKPFRNHSGLAIEPEAVTNSHKPEEIPFSGRNWDGRMPEGFTLSHRLGIRIMNSWSGWDATPPYAPHAAGVDMAQKYGMGVIFGVPTGAIEGHRDNWQQYDEKALREGTKNLLNTYAKLVHPVYISLGNEPPDLPDRLADNVKAYSYIYDEVKKFDPTITVLTTSIGPNEDFFKAGFGKYCDAYDFHCYEDAQNVGLSIQKYHELFKTYGNPHPVWSTEIGLNSEGVSRHAVAIDMIKKFTLFFANGGTNMSWFDLFYPDPDAKIAGSNAESFDVFDSRYVKYNPKVTAVAYYDLINTISTKKFIGQKLYGTDTHAYLMRDADNHNLQVVWKDAGRQDVFMPLPGVQQVEVIRVDGTHRSLNANGKGITLTVDGNPLELLDDGAASITAIPDGIVRGGSTDVTVALKDAAAENVDLAPPPFWQVKKTPGDGTVTFSITAPAVSSVREADMIVTIGDGKGGKVGELYLRPPVIAQISTALMPIPTAPGKESSVRMVLKNNGVQPQDVTWSLSLVEQITLEKGAYEKHEPTRAHFRQASKGSATIAPGATEIVNLAMAGTDPLTVYHVRSVVTDSSGAAAVRDRNVAGFVGVPKVTGTIKLDGALDDPDWARAPVENIKEERQYFSFDPKTVHWKGPADLSGTIRYLWDDKYLYVGVEVTDDVFSNTKQDANLWAGDGLQFLVDPCRGLDENVGKYDYCMAVGTKGPEAWCSLTADAGAPNGEAKDIVVAYKKKGDGTGAITYELAIPWYRLAPFKPRVDGDLGLTMILNEDDGNGRKSFMGWFGNAHSKQVDAVADLILTP